MGQADARWLEWSLPALAWVGGSLDAVSYLALGHVFTANMTGNTVLLATAFGSGELPNAQRSLLAVVGFALGGAAGTSLLRGQPTGWNLQVNRVLSLEAAVLGIAMIAFGWTWDDPLPGWLVQPLIVVLGTAMGLQSAAVRKVHLAGVWTTFITGTLTEWVAGLVEREPSRSSQVAHVQASVYLTYGLAALLTAWLRQRWPPWAVVLPWLLLVGVVALSARRLQRTGRGHSA